MKKKRRFSFPLICLFLFLAIFAGRAQPFTRKALFLGNSYTYVNDLPLLTAALAHSAGDSLSFDSYTPGGYTLGWQPVAHATDPVSLTKIEGNSWDFVVLQEQSQTPSILRLRDSCMFPGCMVLYDSVKSASPCARVLFYLTWGRRFGGIQCFTPNYCSYPFTGFEQMQDTLTYAYKTVADSIGGWIAPVGEAWRFVINNTGIVLHSGDNSHPNLNGSYLAACVFYSVIFGKPTTGLSFTAGLSPDTALMLQHAADSVTFTYAALWNLNNDLPHSSFTLELSGDTLVTHNLSAGADTWLWNFGDGDTSTEFEPIHVYDGAGTWLVKLQACNGCFCDSTTQTVTTIPTGTAGITYFGQSIRLLGPDRDGGISIQNFNEEGTLTIYDLSGRIVSSAPVQAGRSITGTLSNGIWLWRLTNGNSETVARGKFSQFSF